MGSPDSPRRRQSRAAKDEHAKKFTLERSQAPIKALTANQAAYLDALHHSPSVVALGPAGTGKSWLASTYAGDLLRDKRIGRIIITRPNMPTGRSIGFFPGDLNEKFAPWTVPITDAIKERIGKGSFDIAVRNGDIELVPFEVMRGRSWRDAFVILDEAQNASVPEIKMFVTRIGEDCTTVVDGDVTQSDIGKDSGLAALLAMIRHQQLPVPVIEFTVDDIVRSDQCAMWVRAFAAAKL